MYPGPRESAGPDSFRPRADPSVRRQLDLSPDHVETDPFRIIEQRMQQHQQQQQQKLDEGPGRFDPDDWSGMRSKEWTQKLEQLHETETQSSISGYERVEIPEMEGLVLMPEPDEDEEYDEHHPAHPQAMQRLHAEMDAILGESTAKLSIEGQMDALLAESSSTRLTAEQQMMLRQAEIEKMQAVGMQPGFRRPPQAGSNQLGGSPQTGRSDMMPGSGRGPQGPSAMSGRPYPGYTSDGMPQRYDDGAYMYPGGPDRQIMPPTVQRKQEQYDDGQSIFQSLRCFRACT